MFPIQIGMMVAGMVIAFNALFDVFKIEFFKKPIGRVVFGMILFLMGIGMMELERLLL